LLGGKTALKLLANFVIDIELLPTTCCGNTPGISKEIEAMNSRDGADFNAQGAAFALAGDFQRALHAFSQAITFRVQDSSAYYNRALVYRNLNEYPQALADFEQAIALRPSYALAYYQRGITYYLLHKSRRALMDFSTALALKPDDIQSLIGRALVYLAMEEHDQAILNLNSAILHDPLQAGKLGAYGCRGQAHVARRRFSEAIDDFHQALVFKSDDIIMLNRLGAAYTDSGYPDRSLVYYNHALSIKPGIAYTYNNRGEAYRLLERFQEAIEDFDAALALDASLTMVYYNRGLAFYHIGQPLRALADYTRALSLDPALVGVYHDRAEAYCSLKQYREAVADYHHLLDLDPNDTLAAFNRGTMFLYLDEPYEALADFNHVIALCPRFACAYNHRGEAYLRLRALTLAHADCLQSWKLDATHVDHGWMAQWTEMCLHDPDECMAGRLEYIAGADPLDYTAYLCRAVAHLLRGHLSEALAELEGALILDGEQWGAYFWKGMVSAALRHDDEARAALEQALSLKMPPVLLAPLHWLKLDRADFYARDAVPLLNRF
jgi:tetratricopeptide (TPR) repeat protein